MPADLGFELFDSVSWNHALAGPLPEVENLRAVSATVAAVVAVAIGNDRMRKAV